VTTIQNICKLGFFSYCTSAHLFLIVNCYIKFSSF